LLLLNIENTANAGKLSNINVQNVIIPVLEDEKKCVSYRKCFLSMKFDDWKYLAG